MAGMALFLAWVPCVLAGAFAAMFMWSCHEFEEDKRTRDAEDVGSPLATSAAPDYVDEIIFVEREIHLV